MGKHNILKILVIEDNPGDVQLMYEMLDSIDDMKHEVHHVENLAECLKILKEQEFELILLDLGLPETKEVATFKTIKDYIDENQVNQNTPIVVISGTHKPAVIREVLELGAKDYLIKGEFGPHELQRSIVFATYKKNLSKRNPIWSKIKKMCGLGQTNYSSLS